MDSRAGEYYEVANGIRIPAVGQKRYIMKTAEGIQRLVTAQVTDVNKALLSVSQVTDRNHRAVFSKSGSYMEDETNGQRIKIDREPGGTFSLKVMVRAVTEAEATVFAGLR